MNKIIIAVTITLAVAGGGGFYSGMLYGQSSSANLRASFNKQGGAANMMGQRGTGAQQNGGFSGGEIIKKDDKSITVKLNNGGSQIILFSDTTKVMKSIDGSAVDLIVGSQVTATGFKNQDGSITAQSIQLRPAITAPTN